MNIFKYKTAEIEDLTKPLIIDVSAEQRIEDNYLNMLDDMDLRSRGSQGDKQESEIVYHEIKAVVKELNTIKEKLANKKSIDHLISKFEKLMHKYFSAKYAKDRAKEGDGTPGSKDFSDLPPSPAPAPNAPTPTPAPMPPPTMALNKFRKVCAMLDQESFDPNEFLNEDVKKEVINDYAQKTCDAIKNKHSNLQYQYNINDSEIKIIDDKGPIIKMQINEHLNIISIVPVLELQKIYPYHSVGFYQKYWKPIVEAVGHFCLSGPSMLVVADESTLPDVPKNSKSFTLECWNNSKKVKEYIEVSFCGEDFTWLFKPANGMIVQASANNSQGDVSKYTEMDYVNAIVKCIDPNLKTLLGRTGSVIQVIPLTDIIEIDVDFGRGLGVVRLTEQQLEIVPIGR